MIKVVMVMMMKVVMMMCSGGDDDDDDDECGDMMSNDGDVTVFFSFVYILFFLISNS